MAVKKFSLEAVIDLTDKMTKPMQKIEKEMLGFSKTMQKNFGGVGNNLKSFDKRFNEIAKGAAIGLGAASVGAFAIGKSFVDAAGEVQGYKAVLKTMLGTQEAANARFQEMSDFAATTPFELKDVVSLGNQLQALGKYSVGTMTNLGDLAAASKRPIEQVTNAFAKLVSGQKGEAVNMFRELLIGNEDWVAATGKGVKKTGELMATTDEMLAALPKILATKGFTGMMDEMSKTHEGIMSNFSDAVFQFKASIGEGLLGAVDKLMLTITNIIQKMMTVFKVKGKSYVDALAAGIERLADKLASIDVSALVDKVTSFMDFLIGIKNFIVTFGPTLLILVAEIKLVTLAMTVYSTVAAIAGVASLPLTLIILGIMAAVALLTVGIYQMVKHWNKTIIAVKQVGVFFMTLGQIVLKWLLMPINAVLDALDGMLHVMSLIPSVGNIFGEAEKGLAGLQKGMNKFLTGTENKYTLGGDVGAMGLARMAAIGNGPGTANAGVMDAFRYSNPDTRVSESRTSSTTTNRIVVDLNAPAGFGMTPRGMTGAPSSTLNFGAAQ